jgi:hypothetical protein
VQLQQAMSFFRIEEGPAGRPAAALDTRDFERF